MQGQSSAASLKTWTDLITACRQDPKFLAYAATEIHALEQVLIDLHAAKTAQILLNTEKEKATARHLALEQKARDLIVQLHHGARLFFGLRSERLTDFNIKPLGRQPRR